MELSWAGFKNHQLNGWKTLLTVWVHHQITHHLILKTNCTCLLDGFTGLLNEQSAATAITGIFHPGVTSLYLPHAQTFVQALTRLGSLRQRRTRVPACAIYLSVCDQYASKIFVEYELVLLGMYMESFTLAIEQFVSLEDMSS